MFFEGVHKAERDTVLSVHVKMELGFYLFPDNPVRASDF